MFIFFWQTTLTVMRIMTILSRKTTNEINVSTKPVFKTVKSFSLAVPCVWLCHKLFLSLIGQDLLRYRTSTVAAFRLEKDCKWLSKNNCNPSKILNSCRFCWTQTCSSLNFNKLWQYLRGVRSRTRADCWRGCLTGWVEWVQQVYQYGRKKKFLMLWNHIFHFGRLSKG